MNSRSLSVLLSAVLVAVTATVAQGPRAGILPVRCDEDGKWTLAFEPNRGQTAASALFVARTAEGRILLEQDGVRAHLSARNLNFHMKFENAGRGVEPVTGPPTGGMANYYFGQDRNHWIEDVPLFADVRLRNLYSGIDVRYHGREGRLEYDFVVRPGADPAQITFAFPEADSVQIGKGGDLLVRYGEQEIRILAPEASQGTLGRRKKVAVSFAQKSAKAIGFHVTDFDDHAELVIDPVVTFTRLIPEGNSTRLHAMAIDSSSAIYVTGETYADDYPVTIGSYTGTSTMAYLTKLDPTGANIVYSTEFGSGTTNTVSLDASGNAYVTGRATYSNFPTTSSNFGTCPSDCYAAFAAKFDTSGHVVYSTILTSGQSMPTAAKVDSSGRLLVAGTADTSLQTVNALQSTGSGGFFLRLNATATAFDFASYYGSGGFFGYSGWPTALDTDAAGNIYLAGQGKVSLVNPLSDAGELYISETSADGQTILASTQFGGQGGQYESVAGLKVGSDNTVYIAGSTQATDFPFTMNAFRLPTLGANYSILESFATAFKPGLSGLVYSTYLTQGTVRAMTLDASGGLYVSGYYSGEPFPLLNPVVSDVQSGSYIMRLDKTGALTWSTEFGGGTSTQDIYGIAVDSSSNVYVAGVVGRSSQLKEDILDPVVVGTGNDYLRQSLLGYPGFLGYSTFVSKISTANRPQVSLSYWLPNLALRNVGSAPLTFSSISGTGLVHNCGTGLSAGDSCILTMQQPATVTINSNAQPSSQSFSPGYTLYGSGDVIEIKPGSAYFGPQQLNTTSAPHAVKITNLKSVGTYIDSIVASGAASQTNNCPAVLPAGGSCTMQLTLTPTASTGLGTIKIGYNSGSYLEFYENSQAVSADPFVLSTAMIGFGDIVEPNISLMRTVTITNQVNATVAAPSASISGDPGFAITASTCTGQLAPYQGCAVGVQFTPTMNGASSATLSVSGVSQLVTLNASGKLKSAVTVNPNQVQMPSTYIGISVQSSAITLTNTSSQTAKITGITFGLADYSETDTCAGSIAPGTSCAMTVVLVPQTSGYINTTMTINFDSTTPQVIQISGYAQVQMSVTPSSLDFGSSTGVGSDSPEQGISLGNNYYAPLSYTITITGPFATKSTCPNPMPVNVGCAAGVVFRPTMVGLNQTGDAAVSIAGGAQVVHVALTGGAISAGAEISPLNFDFGQAYANAVSTPTTITITNNQSFVLNIPQPQITGAADQFQLADNCTVIQPNTSCNATIAFAPTKVGTQTATLTFQNGGSPVGQIPVTVSGTGISMPGFYLLETGYSFGFVDVGRTMTHKVRINSYAPITLALPAITTSGTGSDNFTVVPEAACSSVPPLGGCDVTVTFAPTSSGPKNLNFSFSSGATTATTLTYNASGTGNDFTFGGAATSKATATASSATFLVTLNSDTSYTGTLNLTCTADSATNYGPCTLSQNSVTLPAQVTVTITKSTHASNRSPLVWPFALAMLFAPLGLLVTKKRAVRVVLGSTAIACVLAMTSCGGGGGGSTPPPSPQPTYVTYTYTLTATNSTTNVSHSTKLTLQVQQ